MKQFNRVKGSVGEQIAADFLRSNGFHIIEQNYSSKFGEIDIIATKNGVIHFIEVKLKVGDRYGIPEEMINKYKLNKVMRMAEMYLIQNPKLNNYAYQVDVVAIVTEKEGGTERITHYENVSIDFL